MNEDRRDLPFRVFIGVVGASLIAYGVQYVSEPDGGHRAWGSALLVAAALIEVTAYYWPRIASGAKSQMRLISALCVAAMIGLFVQRTRSDLYGLIAAGSILVVYFVWRVWVYVIRLRRDLDQYVMSRRLTARQREAIEKNVSGSGSVTIKVNSRDQEATEYAGQLFGALRRTGWNVEMSTADAPPSADGYGLRSHIDGQNSAPDKLHPGGELNSLVRALVKSGVQVPGGGGQGAGDYKMFLVVGKRPVFVGDPPLRSRIGSWIMRTLIMRPPRP